MHNIHYAIYDEKVKKSLVLADIQEHAEQDGDGYSSTFTWHDNTAPFESYEKAKAFIDNVDRGWYDDHAVRFLDYSEIKSAKVDEYQKKIADIEKAYRQYRENHSIHKLTAKYIGCEMCGSKLNKDLVIGEKCPFCKCDLRSNTTREKLLWYENKIKDYNKRIETEKMKQKQKAKIKWLVKYEYHS